MTHDEAVASQAAERYLLGQFSAAQCDEFERHYFDCAECAADLRAGAVLVANARAVFRVEARWTAMRRRRLAAGLALAALLMLLTAFSHQVFFVVPQLKRELAAIKAPQAYPAFFLKGVARGEEQVVEVPRGSRFVGLAMDLPPGAHYPGYECKLLEEAGRTLVSLPVPAPAAAESALNVLLPVSQAPPGRYTLLLRAPTGAELNRFIFRIQFK